jgi:hypothetical protein
MQVNDNYYRQLISEQQWWEKFMAGSGCCVICFNANSLMLEDHHPFGKANSSVTITTCGSHHLLLSRMQRSWPHSWLKSVPKSPKVMEALKDRAIKDLLKVMDDYMRGVDGTG